MATRLVIEDHIDQPHKGLTQDDIKAEDSASNVSANTRMSKGSHSSLAKTRAKKAELLAKQRRQKERNALEQKKLQLSTSSEVLEIEERKRRLALEAEAAEREHQKIHIKAQQKLLEIESENLQLQTDLEVEAAQEEIYAQYEQYENLTGLSFPTPDTQRKTQVSVSQAHQDDAPVKPQACIKHYRPQRVHTRRICLAHVND